jgi:EAL domain-containing protein (putative c-di-GMP-specific phosphodiesterase class I)
MAETFGLETVAEGVETPEQLQKVVDLGCDCIQGFLFSKPVAPNEVPATIAYIEEHFSGYQEVA